MLLHETQAIAILHPSNARGKEKQSKETSCMIHQAGEGVTNISNLFFLLMLDD